MINDLTIRKINDAVNILDVISDFEPNIRKSGTNYQCLCPFHADRTLGSFSINLSPGMAYRNGLIDVELRPRYSFQTKNNDPTEIYPYGFAQTSGELDDALEHMAKVFEDMLELAEVEKTMQLLAEEIEKTRRRVNALEYVMIPDLESNIKYITMKLEENENATKVRLLKVKEMVLQEAHNYKQ